MVITKQEINAYFKSIGSSYFTLTEGNLTDDNKFIITSDEITETKINQKLFKETFNKNFFECFIFNFNGNDPKIDAIIKKNTKVVFIYQDFKKFKIPLQFQHVFNKDIINHSSPSFIKSFNYNYFIKNPIDFVLSKIEQLVFYIEDKDTSVYEVDTLLNNLKDKKINMRFLKSYDDFVIEITNNSNQPITVMVEDKTNGNMCLVAKNKKFTFQKLGNIIGTPIRCPVSSLPPLKYHFSKYLVDSKDDFYLLVENTPRRITEVMQYYINVSDMMKDATFAEDVQSYGTNVGYYFFDSKNKLTLYNKNENIDFLDLEFEIKCKGK